MVDARDLLIACVLSDDPVVYIDDRWLYNQEAELAPAADVFLCDFSPRILRPGDDITLVAVSFSVKQCFNAAAVLAEEGISVEVVDPRVINSLDINVAVKSVAKTGRLCAVDGGWTTCGLAGEVIASVSGRLSVSAWKAPPRRITSTDAPAPTSKPLQAVYYTPTDDIVNGVKFVLSGIRKLY